MKFCLRLRKKKLHFLYLYISQKSQSLHLSSNLVLKSLVYTTNLIKGFDLKVLRFKYIYYLNHKDIRILLREFNTLKLIVNSLWNYLFFKAYSININKIQVIRSPFVYSSSREHYGLSNFRIQVIQKTIYDLIIYKYFPLTKLIFYFINFSLISIKRNLY